MPNPLPLRLVQSRLSGADIGKDTLIGQFGRIGIGIDAQQIGQRAGSDAGFDVLFDRIADHELNVQLHIGIELAELGSNLKHLLGPVRCPDQCRNAGPVWRGQTGDGGVLLVATAQNQQTDQAG